MYIRMLIAALWLITTAGAAVTRLEVEERSAVVPGRTFGKTGEYERLRGRVYFQVDPKHRLNRGIVDIDKVPVNAAGLVEFSADIYLLQPRDVSKGNGIVLYEAPNRGGKGMLSVFNRASSAVDPKAERDLGDGLLMREGYTLLWLGWQHDVPRREGLMRLYAPVASGVRGVVRGEFTPAQATTRIPLGDAGHVPYLPVPANSLRLTVRDGIYGARQPVATSDYELSGSDIVLRSAAQPGRTYEFVYESESPAVAGLGLAAVRDVIALLKYGGADTGVFRERGGSLKYALGFGVSQSAMLLRALVYEGFNEAENGKPVLDGILGHVAGARRSTLQRFAQPSRTAGPLRNASFSTTDQFPFTDVEQMDGDTSIRDGVLARAAARGVTPKIFWTNSSYEYWGSSGSLVHTTPDGKADAAPPASSRIYLFAGGQHGPAAFPPRAGAGQNLPNSNDYKWLLRSLLGRLRDWVTEGKEPPASSYPMLRDRTLVEPKDYLFPSMPGIAVPDHAHKSHRLDFGESYRGQGVITVEPPRVMAAFRSQVPQCDKDGNDVAGVRTPFLSAPLGTYTGWNLRAHAAGASNELLGNTGSFVPFARTALEREQSGDPRPSIRERYSDREEYLRKLKGEAMNLVARGFLLSEDVEPVVAAAGTQWDWIMTRRSKPSLTPSAQSR